jgi:DNA-3-methyladenine glycosylase
MENSQLLSLDFYRRTDVVGIARELLGKHLLTSIDGVVCGGMITETEAYAGITDRASHAFGGRRTSRTEVMFMDGGTAYVYLCYGIHSLFNVVTNVDGVPEAVLIRAIQADTGIAMIGERLRPGKTFSSIPYNLTNGPGKVAKALGIHYSHSGISLLGQTIRIEDRGIVLEENSILSGPRIGVEYAGNDALLPYRFLINIK